MHKEFNADKREHMTIAWTGVCNFYNQRIICFHKQLISAQGHLPHIIGVFSDNSIPSNHANHDNWRSAGAVRPKVFTFSIEPW